MSQNRKTSELSCAAWSRYWSAGNKTSLPEVFPENYTGSLHEFWESAFVVLPDGSHVLDLCTGNGAIAQLACDHASTRNLTWQISAIDRATISAVNRCDAGIQVQFLSGISAEHLPFPSHSVDLVVGQFALEYCDRERTLAELVRVLRPEGLVAFIVHHAESITVRSAREFATMARALLTGTGILRRVRDCAAATAMAPATGPQRDQRQLDGIQSDLELLRQRHPRDGALAQIALRVTDMLSRLRGGNPVSETEPAELEQRIRLHLQRTDDLLEAAHDAARMSSLAASLRAAGFQLDAPALCEFEGTLLGWQFTARAALSGSRNVS